MPAKPDRLARRLVAELAAIAGVHHRWTMLSDVSPRLGVSWLEAEAAAEHAAREGWVEFKFQSLLREPGRQLLKPVKSRAGTKSRPSRRP